MTPGAETGRAVPPDAVPPDATTPRTVTSSAEPPWVNWGRTVCAHPQRVASPVDEADVAAIVRRSAADGLRVKPVGTGHSFTAIAATDGVQLRIDRLAGLRDVEPEVGLVTVGAGTPLNRLHDLLSAHGLAVANLGDVGGQTVAGAIATGTHGTGPRFHSLSEQVRALRIVTADGSVVNATPRHRPEVFQAARLGLGALGIITEVTLAVVPAFLLRAHDRRERLEPVLERFSRADDAHHSSFLWFPYTREVFLQSRERVTDLPEDQLGAALNRADQEVLHNGAFGAGTMIARHSPSLTPLVNRAGVRSLRERHWIGTPQQLWLEQRRVRFREMEYAIPREALPAAVPALDAMIRARRLPVSYPLRMRTGAAEQTWLAPCHGRASAYISLHRAVGDPFVEYFRAAEEILRAYDGRPHWGKLHSLRAADLTAAYPRFDDFRRVRDELDPDRLFGNEHLQRLLD